MRHNDVGSRAYVAYPELVSRVGFQKSQIKGLVKVSASNFSKGVIRVYLKKNHGRGGGVSGQPETPLDTPLVGETGLKRDLNLCARIVTCCHIQHISKLNCTVHARTQ